MFVEYRNSKKDNDNKSKFSEHMQKFWPAYAFSAVIPVIILSSFCAKHLENKKREDEKIKNKKIREEYERKILCDANGKVKKVFNESKYSFSYQRSIKDLDEYINAEIISENIVNLNSLLNQIKKDPETKKAFGSSHISEWSVVSSYRNLNNSKPTEFEKKLDEAVDNGDLPIKQFTLSQIDELYKQKTNNYQSNKSAVFRKMEKINAIRLHEYAQDGAVVQVASQFNALESMGNYFSPVKNWIGDGTQGPRCSLQDVIAAKHRESAYLKGKLPDAIKGILESCQINGEKINEKHKIYSHGYLELYKIGEKSINDLKFFTNHIKQNIGKLGLNAQWVTCEDGKKQFQLFLAAPSFQGHGIDWKKNDERTECFKEICKTLVVAQYKASAQIAVIKSISQNKQIELHVTRVGQSAFGNPKEIMTECLAVIYNTVKNYNVKVILHDYVKNSWNDDIKNLNLIL